MDYCIVITTTDSKEIADKLTKTVLDKKLAACIQRYEIKSSYIWNGKIEEALEFKLEIKTVKNRVKELIEIVKSMHNYEVPEILVLPIIDGNEDYFNWIDESLK